jgi:hypothetical protein
MVTSKHERMKIKDMVKIVRVGSRMIIKQRTTLTMIDWRLMLVRDRKRSRR